VQIEVKKRNGFGGHTLGRSQEPEKTVTVQAGAGLATSRLLLPPGEPCAASPTSRSRGGSQKPSI
jgi:hypothetical protein